VNSAWLLLGLAMVMAVLTLGSMPSANAAAGDKILNVDFEAPTVNGALNVPGATTGFSLSTLFGQASYRGG
jgi:hypothetical protein